MNFLRQINQEGLEANLILGKKMFNKQEIDFENKIQNAKLIAAAPDLLEACQMAQGAIKELLQIGGGQVLEEAEQNEIVKKLEQAIQKALNE